MRNWLLCGTVTLAGGLVTLTERSHSLDCVIRAYRRTYMYTQRKHTFPSTMHVNELHTIDRQQETRSGTLLLRVEVFIFLFPLAVRLRYSQAYPKCVLGNVAPCAVQYKANECMQPKQRYLIV